MILILRVSIVQQTNGTGVIKKDQIEAFYQLFEADTVNANAKAMISQLLKALQKSKGTCEAGRIVAKFFRTIISNP